MGEGDHTWIETYAVERADYDKMVELETGKKVKPDPIPTVLDDAAFIEEWDETLPDGLDEVDEWFISSGEEEDEDDDYTEDED